MNDKIRELRLAGWSERRIATELGVTRYRGRTALARFQAPAAVGATRFAAVELAVSRAGYREGDDEQLSIAELAFGVAEWLDAQPEPTWDTPRLEGSLQYIVDGVMSGVNPLTRIHARRVLAPT